jgi:cobalamin-dependent methionine synthase I
VLLIDQSLELFHGTLAGALNARDREPLLSYARERLDAGAHAIDVNVGVEGDAHGLIWALAQLRRALPGVPLFLDGPGPATLAVTLDLCEREGVHGPLVVNALPCGSDNAANDVSARTALLRATARARAGLVISPRGADSGDPKADAAIFRAALDAAVEARDAGVRETIYLDALAWPALTDASRARRALRLLRAWRPVDGVTPLVAIDNVTAGLTGEERGAMRRLFGAAAVGAGAEALILPAMDTALLSALDRLRRPELERADEWLTLVAAAAHEGRALPSTPEPPVEYRAAAGLLFGEPFETAGDRGG